MKKFNLTFLFSFSLICLFAQQEVKKYVFIEHFTNTLCTICSSRNPAMFNTLSNYEGDYHHIAYHPPAPYSACKFYQHNKEENSGRASYYNILGTPSITLNGVLQGGGSPLLRVAKFEEQLNLTSPIQVLVEETTGQDRQVTITVKTVGDAPAQDLRVYAAVVEKEVQYNAPNGEDLHHNVFRDMLSDLEGDSFTAAASGQEMTFTFNYSIDSAWVADETYVVAFVQDPSTLEVFNSGTRFDENTVSIRPPVYKEKLPVYPNPANDLLQIDLQDFDLTEAPLAIYNAAGSLVLTQQVDISSAQVVVKDLPKGLYVIKVNTQKGVLTGRFVKN